MRVILLIISLFVCHAAVAIQPQSNGSKEYAKDKAHAARQAQRRFKGRVLKVETRQTTYRVKLLQKSGRVVSVEIKRSIKNKLPKNKKAPGK